MSLCLCVTSLLTFAYNVRYAYPWWKEKIINSDLKRKDGLCPLTPEETALILRALDIDQSIQIYIAAGEIYGGDRRMSSLAASYPNLVSTYCKKKKKVVLYEIFVSFLLNLHIHNLLCLFTLF